MFSVAAGAGLVVHTPRGAVDIVTLEGADMQDDWSLAVSHAPATLGHGVVPVDIPIEIGLVRVSAVITVEGGLTRLRPTAEGAAEVTQRRQDVRAHVRLDVHGAVVSPEVTHLRQVAGIVDATFNGRTRDLSGGGLWVDPLENLPGAGHLPLSSRVLLWLTLPDGSSVQTLVTVVTTQPSAFSGTFTDIRPRDRETLIGLVFARHRADLGLLPRPR